LADLGAWLESSQNTPISHCTMEGLDLDMVFEAKRTFHDVQSAQAPDLFLPTIGQYQMTDWDIGFPLSLKMPSLMALDINRTGALVTVKPDKSDAHVLPLGEREEITEFFAKNIIQQNVRVATQR
jgi:phenol 2-monooxygenase